MMQRRQLRCFWEGRVESNTVMVEVTPPSPARTSRR